MIWFLFSVLQEYKLIGQFRINKDRFLGGGGSGRVYEAEHITTKEKLAAKEILMTTNKDINRKIRNELYTLSKIPYHRNIINFIDHKVEDSFLWLLMELCPMGSMDIYLTKHITTTPEKFDMMLQISEGIQHLQHPEMGRLQLLLM